MYILIQHNVLLIQIFYCSFRQNSSKVSLLNYLKAKSKMYLKLSKKNCSVTKKFLKRYNTNFAYMFKIKKNKIYKNIYNY